MMVMENCFLWKKISKSTFFILTLGRDCLAALLMVVMVRTVVIPRETLAGADSAGIQNETQEMMTTMHEGTYVSIRKYPTRLWNLKFAMRYE